MLPLEHWERKHLLGGADLQEDDADADTSAQSAHRPSHADECVHPSFRLFLTTSSAGYLPREVVEMCVVASASVRQGVRAALQVATADGGPISRDTLDYAEESGDEDQARVYLATIYSLAFTHAALQERGHFGPVGWQAPYSFQTSDLASSLDFLQVSTGLAEACSEKLRIARLAEERRRRELRLEEQR